MRGGSRRLSCRCCWQRCPLVSAQRNRGSDALIAAGLLGLALIIAQGFAVGLNGWNWATLTTLFGTPGPSQNGMGLGAALTSASFLMLLCHGLAARGWCRGDAFVVCAIGSVVALTIVFVFFPVATILASAVKDNSGALAFGEFTARFFDRSIWGLDCIGSNLRCGVAWNTLFLAVLVGFGTTALGLAFALIATRTGMRFKGVLRVAHDPADHHAAVRDRACADPAVRTLGQHHGAIEQTGSTSRPRAGSTACPACSSRRCSPSRRSRSWC